MSLENLRNIGQLEQHETDAAQVRKMFESSARNLADARQENISRENRLDIAYRAIMQLAMVALWANGYRPPTNRPGHHQTMIQSLVHSTGLDNDSMLVLDSFRGRRNAIDYTGEGVDEGTVEACIAAGEHLMQHVRDWFVNNRPDLGQRLPYPRR